MQVPGTNEVLFVETTPGWKWGVTGLLLTEGAVTPVEADIALEPGVLESGSFGHNFGSNLHEEQLLVAFESTGTDLVLSVTGFDIDYDNEITVYLNGAPLGNLRIGPNNGLNGRDMFAIPADLQLPGINEILFFEKTAGWTWGVTNLLLSEGQVTGGPGDVVLSPDVLETGKYGHKYGTGIHETQFRANFLSSSNDLTLSVTGFDIDFPDEIAVYLNGVPIGFLSPGTNNGLNAGDSFAIPSDMQVPGTNEVLFVETTPGWKWGVTNLLLTVATP